MGEPRGIEPDSGPRVVMLLGPPGSGKGTHGGFLKRFLNIPAISTGEILRAECSTDLPRGRSLRKLLACGGLVSDDMVNELVAARLAQPGYRQGFLLDGYPRSLAQAQFLDAALKPLGLPAPLVLHLDASPETVCRRLTGRRQCPACGRLYNLFFQPPAKRGVCDADDVPLEQRPDDRESVVWERLAVYQRATRPLLDYYRGGDFHCIDANRPEDVVREELKQILAGLPVTGLPVTGLAEGWTGRPCLTAPLAQN